MEFSICIYYDFNVLKELSGTASALLHMVLLLYKLDAGEFGKGKVAFEAGISVCTIPS